MKLKKIIFAGLLVPNFAFAAERLAGLPQSAVQILEAQAVGVQIYTCIAKDRSFTWVFKAPDAQLIDKNRSKIGTHFAGPTWKLNDGSSVVGELVSQVNAADPKKSIPSLLLKMKSKAGDGLLSLAAYITRTNTRGGVAPDSSCDQKHKSQEIRVPYTATYNFYTAVKPQQ